jgi:hypothetical protein
MVQVLVAMIENQHNELLADIDAAVSTVLAENERSFNVMQGAISRKFKLMKEVASIRCKKSIDMVLRWGAGIEDTTKVGSGDHTMESSGRNGSNGAGGNAHGGDVPPGSTAVPGSSGM